MHMRWCVIAKPHACKTAMKPILAPRCLGSAAIASMVSVEAHHCMIGRGIHKPGSALFTSRMLGCFRDTTGIPGSCCVMQHNAMMSPARRAPLKVFGMQLRRERHKAQCETCA